GIYWLSERKPASPYIYDVAQRVPWARERARGELMADLDRNRPGAIVVQHGDRFGWVTGDEYDSAQALREFPELESLIDRDYTLHRTIDDFDVYLRSELVTEDSKK